jgi:hypothetical protein
MAIFGGCLHNVLNWLMFFHIRRRCNRRKPLALDKEDWISRSLLQLFFRCNEACLHQYFLIKLTLQRRHPKKIQKPVRTNFGKGCSCLCLQMCDPRKGAM